MRIVLIGGSGFVGTRLTPRLLAAGHEVTIADIEPSRDHRDRWRHCDVTDPGAVRAAIAGADAVINLAAVHRDDVRPVERYRRVNVDGAQVVCDAAEAAGIRRMIFASSVAVYGLPGGEPDETAGFDPINEYGRTKAAAEPVYRAWARRSPDRHLVIVRPTVIFGEGNRGNVHNLLQQLISGRFVMVGDGRNRKSMAYVENVAAFFEFVLTLGPGEQVFNYVDKPDLEMNGLMAVVRAHQGRDGDHSLRVPYWIGYGGALVLDAVAWMLRRNFAISSVRVKKFCSTTVFKADRARLAGFVPSVSLQEGLERTLNHEFPREPGRRSVDGEGGE